MIEIEPLRSDISLLKANVQVSPADVDERISKSNSRFFEELVKMQQ
jgi:hypothetical protein